MVKKTVFLALAILAAATVSYPTISNAHRAIGKHPATAALLNISILVQL